MPSKLIEHIIRDLQNQSKQVLLVENSDGFLKRLDVGEILHDNGVIVELGSQLKQRIKYELRDNTSILVLIGDDNANYLEDMKRNSTMLEFHLDSYISGYHIPSIVNENLETLEVLYGQKQIISLTKSQTAEAVKRLTAESEKEKDEVFDTEGFFNEIEQITSEPNIDWRALCKSSAVAILASISTEQYPTVMSKVNEINELFQEKIARDYQQTKVSSYIKRPQIVSHVLNYINHNFKNDLVALIVVDGLGYWQYELLRKEIKAGIKEDAIYSWLPSITQLSRQAIFKGGNPDAEYKQGPTNESKLWYQYWVDKGLNDFQIKYQYQKVQLNELNNVKRLAVVYKDLDEYMHSSKDYKDLLRLTENWIERSKIMSTIEVLLSKNFKVFLTTDHGNIEATGWRGLQGTEKLGTNKSGSRSERHLEYSENWLKEDFLSKNPELKDSVVVDEQSIYFKNNLSFSRDETLVTHGGAHFLEVLIPFVQIFNEE